MTIARFEEVACFDDEGNVEGLQFDSKKRRLQEWRNKKDDEEFELLVAKLRQRKRYLAWYARRKDEPGFREKMRAHNKRMKDRHRDRRNAENREKYRTEIARKEPTVNVCAECQKQFTQEAGYKKKRAAKFCSRACRNRDSYKRRDRDTTARKEAVLKVVQSHYSLTLKEAMLYLDLSQASVQALLNLLVKECKIKKYDEEKPYRYSIW
jgi:hypothetical protein